MLWVDKYRPKKLDELSYNPSVTSRLSSLRGNMMPHLLFYGPSGAGKKTRITCLLREIFGAGAERLRIDKRTFKTPTNKTVDINMISSNYHIEMSPGDAGLNDRFIIQDVIKEMAQNKALTGAKAFSSDKKTPQDTKNGSGSEKPDFKIVLLVEVDRLSRPAQAALRRTMEKYSATCRLILCCENPSKVIEPVRSRCLGIRVPAPSHDDIISVLQSVAAKQKVTLQQPLAKMIAEESSRNVRRAILMFEAYHVQNRGLFEFGAPQKFPPVRRTDWELYISELANGITNEQSPQQLIAAREKLYELLINCIPPQIIIKTLALELCKNLDDELKHEVIEWASFYEHRIALGGKEIFHLEAFIAKYMALYKQYLNSLFG